jgi:hypothetical protein
MIDKLSGKVAYAVMSFGGFMGIGEDYYPLPWSLLTYNPQLGATKLMLARSNSGERRATASRRTGIGQTARANNKCMTTTGLILIGHHNVNAIR